MAGIAEMAGVNSRAKIPCDFYYSTDFQGGPPLQLFYRRGTDGREMKFGAPHQPGDSRSMPSLAGDVWVVKRDDKVIHTIEIVEPAKSGERLRVNLATGTVTSSTAGSIPPSGTKQAIELGLEMASEFSPSKVVAERSITLTRYPDTHQAYVEVESLYGMALSTSAKIEAFRPMDRRPHEEARIVTGSRVVAIDGTPVAEHTTAKPNGSTPIEQVRNVLRKLRCAFTCPWHCTVPYCMLASQVFAIASTVTLLTCYTCTVLHTQASVRGEYLDNRGAT